MDRQIYTIFIFIRLTVKMMMHHDGLNIDFNDREELSNILERWTYKLQNSFINSFHGDELQFKSIHFNFKTVLFTMKLYH